MKVNICIGQNFNISAPLFYNILLTDVAISCPFGGENKQGLVLIYNGHAGGLREKPLSGIAGQWASSATPSALPASFGYALRGGKDQDNNGYPGKKT